MGTTATAVHTPRAVRVGAVTVSIQGMVAVYGRYMALTFRTDDVTGLYAGFHGSTAEMRRFAAELIRHADITDEHADSTTGESPEDHMARAAYERADAMLRAREAQS